MPAPSPLLRFSPFLLLVCVVGLFWADPASAKDHQHEGSHITSKSPAQVVTILTAYEQTCESGCRFSRPNLKEIRRLGFQANERRWYTWSEIKNSIRNVKFFTEVTLESSGGARVLRSRQLDESDQALIAALEEHSGLPHAPAFDKALTVTAMQPSGEGTRVTQSVFLTSSGMLSMWSGKILASVKESMAAVFSNIGS